MNTKSTIALLALSAVAISAQETTTYTPFTLSNTGTATTCTAPEGETVNTQVTAVSTCVAACGSNVEIAPVADKDGVFTLSVFAEADTTCEQTASTNEFTCATTPVDAKDFNVVCAAAPTTPSPSTSPSTSPSNSPSNSPSTSPTNAPSNSTDSQGSFASTLYASVALVAVSVVASLL